LEIGLKVISPKTKSAAWIFSLLIIIFLLAAACLSVYAQSYTYEINTIPLKGDLVNFSGTCFLQDRDGFIWFGSADGLYRYNGNSIKIYRHVLDDSNSLSNNYVDVLFEDSEGLIWIGTNDGLNRFDKYTETFQWYKPDPHDTSGIKGSSINDITEDNNGNLWISTYYGFSRYDRKTETFKNYEISRKDKSTMKLAYEIRSLYLDRGGYLWLCSEDGVIRFNTASGSMEKIKNPWFTWAVYEDKSGRLWLISDQGLYSYNRQNQSLEQHLNESDNPNRLKNQNIRAMLEDKSGNIWIRTLDGIYCFTQGLELRFYRENSHVYSYTSDYTSLTEELFVDNTGTMWYYNTDGINQIINKYRNFTVYNFDLTLGKEVNCIFVENKNLIWFGTNHGICSYDRSKNTCKLHYGDTLYYGFPHTARSMYMNREGTLWIGMAYEGLFSMARSEDSVKQFRRIIPESVDSTTLDKFNLYGISRIFEDSQGRLWIGVVEKRSLSYYDRKENRMIRLVDNPSAKDKLPKWSQIRHETGSDTLWAIGWSGVYKIVPPFTSISKTEIMASDVVKCQPDNNDGVTKYIPGVVVSHMVNSGDIWLGTFNRGLVKLTKKIMPGTEGNEFELKSFTTNQGLPSNQVTSILPDGKGNLWLGTTGGLSKFNLQSETFTNYSVRHGLPINQFRSESAAKGIDGELFFGTRKGMVYPGRPEKVFPLQ